MDDKPYIRDPKGKRGGQGKWGAGEEDLEDYEQERVIQEWLKREGRVGEIELKHITGKGNVRNTLLKASFSLDQRISTEDGSRTFADLIAGSDGRDLECGGVVDEFERDPEEQISGYLFALGFNQGDVKWLIKIFKLSIKENMQLFPTSAIDSEW